MSLSSNIVKLRTNQQRTQQQVADAINVKRVTYTHWESGRVTPPIDMLILLAREFGVTLDELCNFTPDISKRPSEFDVARTKLKTMGIKSKLFGEDVYLDVYGTEYTISKSDLPDMVKRAEVLHRRMMKTTTREMFAAATILTLQDGGKNKVLTQDYLVKMLDKVDTWTELNETSLTPVVLAGMLKERLLLMSKKNRKAAWEQAVQYIADRDEFMSQVEGIEIEDISKNPEWKYPAQLFES